MQSNPVGWFEIYVQDLERATKFYESVLNLKLVPLESPMPTLKMMAFPMTPEASGAAGTLAKMDGVCSGGNSTLVYFSCQDCGTEADRVVAAGGKLHQGKTSIGPYGFIALAFDPDGNMFGLHSRQ